MNTVFLTVAERCNLHCTHCVWWEKTLSPEVRRLDFDTINELLPALRRAGYEQINLTGGEPLLMPFVLDVFDELHGQSFTTGLLTNGILISPEVAGRLRRARLSYLAVSLNSLRPEINDRLRGGFHRAMRGLLHAIEAGIENIHVNVTVGQPNIGEIVDFARFAEAHRVLVRFQPLSVPPDAPDYATLSLAALPLHRRREICDQISDPCRLTGNLPFLRLFRALYCVSPPQHPLECFAANRHGENCVVDHNGDVFACFFRKDLSAGNIFRDGAAAVFHRLAATRRAVAGAPCFGDHCVGLHTG